MKKTMLFASLLIVFAGSSGNAQGYKDPSTAFAIAVFVPAGDWLYRGQIPEFIGIAGVIAGPAVLGNNILKSCYTSSWSGEKSCRTNAYLKAYGAIFTIGFHFVNLLDAEENTHEYNRSRGNLSLQWTDLGPAISLAFGANRSR